MARNGERQIVEREHIGSRLINVGQAQAERRGSLKEIARIL
jgi:hypothetical protein